MNYLSKNVTVSILIIIMLKQWIYDRNVQQVILHVHRKLFIYNISKYERCVIYMFEILHKFATFRV